MVKLAVSFGFIISRYINIRLTLQNYLILKMLKYTCKSLTIKKFYPKNITESIILISKIKPEIDKLTSYHTSGKIITL